MLSFSSEPVVSTEVTFCSLHELLEVLGTGEQRMLGSSKVLKALSLLPLGMFLMLCYFEVISSRASFY